MEFESANPTIIKSIKQRDLLNTWLRLYARAQAMPAIAEYRPERLADELPDLVYYTLDTARQPPRLLIQSDGTRMSSAYGHTGKGRYLDDFLGPRLAPVVMPVYYEWRGNTTLPTAKLRSVIDRDLFHRAPGRIPAGDVIEFD